MSLEAGALALINQCAQLAPDTFALPPSGSHLLSISNEETQN